MTLYLCVRFLLFRFCSICPTFFSFFFNATATTEIYTLSLHDALPIFLDRREHLVAVDRAVTVAVDVLERLHRVVRSEEHTSELQSRQYLVCRLLLEKKK